MSKPSVPEPTNPQVVAGDQTKSNVNTAVANAALTPNQYSPFGSTTYTANGGQMVDGNWVPHYDQTTTLNPTLQGILTGTQNTAASLIPTGQTLANQASSSLVKPLNFNGVNNSIIQGGPQAIDQSATNDIFKGSLALLQPGFDQSKTQLEDQLSRQGIPVGSPAYNSAMQNLGATQGLQTQAALGGATSAGINSANNMFGLALQGQQQQLGQQQLAQTNPLTNLSALYGATA